MGTTLKKKSRAYNYKYVELATIHEELEAQGITYRQYIEFDPAAEADYIFTILKVGGKELPPLQGCRVIISNSGGMGAAQQQGAAITYARRYSLLMALGWATEDDEEKLGGVKEGGSDANIETKAGVARLDFPRMTRELAGIKSEEALRAWHERYGKMNLTDKQKGAIDKMVARRRREMGLEDFVKERKEQ